MKTLKEYKDILEKNGLLTAYCGETEQLETIINDVSYNSMQVKQGTLFICKGANFKSQYLSDAIDKGAVCYVSYKDLEGLQTEITNICESATAKVFGTEFSFQSDYEADDEMDFDKHVYVGGVEGTELDNAYAETGAYHEKATGKYHQYTNYSSKTYYEYSDKTVKNILKTLKDAYGITLSEKKTKKAVKLAFNTAKENDDFYSLVDKVTLKGNGYSETITVTVDGFVNEGDEGGDYGFYIFVDRDRVYN